jgi:hypothetical protein
METKCSSEMSVHFQMTTLHDHLCKNIKSYNMLCVFCELEVGFQNVDTHSTAGLEDLVELSQ